MTNTERFCKQLGWQGGTIHQVAETLGLTLEQILDAKFVKTPKWTKSVKLPALIDPKREHIESIHPDAYPITIQLYLDDGWIFLK